MRQVHSDALTRQQFMRPPALAQPGSASGDNDGLGESTRVTADPDHTSNWKALSALAAECTAAFRHSLVSDSDKDVGGHVEQGSAGVQDPTYHVDNCDLGYYASDTDTRSQLTSAQLSAAVRAEVERVATKIVPLNLDTEVVVRFDFVTNRDSRVRQSADYQQACTHRNT